MSIDTLRAQRPFIHWFALLALTAALIPVLQWARLPAAFFLGPLFAAAVLASADIALRVSAPLYLGAEAIIGCLIARALHLPLLSQLSHHWPLFLGAILAVLAAALLLSVVLMRYRVLPGTTAIWGSFPGASLVMTLMAEHFGEDVRLVAFMQYLRVVCVALVASLVARVWMGASAHEAVQYFPAVDWHAFALTLAVALPASGLGSLSKSPAAPLLLPMVACAVLQDIGRLKIELPPAILAVSYAVVGWSIGARFTRDIVGHVARAFPRVLISILALILMCAGIGYALVMLAGIDPLSAFLATSPGGADSIAIIAAGSQVNLPFVMAMQSARFAVILLLGPAIARFMARRARARAGTPY